MEASSLPRARMNIAMRSVAVGAPFAEGYELSLRQRALVPTSQIGRVLSGVEAAELLRRFEEGYSPPPRRNPAGLPSPSAMSHHRRAVRVLDLIQSRDGPTCRARSDASRLAKSGHHIPYRRFKSSGIEGPHQAYSTLIGRLGPYVADRCQGRFRRVVPKCNSSAADTGPGHCYLCQAAGCRCGRARRCEGRHRTLERAACRQPGHHRRSGPR
jgi:hypothetical protein